VTHVEPPQPAAGLASSAVPPAPIAWPSGVTAAACLTFDMDAEAPMLTEDISAITRMTVMSHQSYGPLVGVPRILALLKRHDLRATFFIPGYSAHRYPDVVRAVAEAGHEIAHHSYFHENTIGMDEKTEAAMIDLGLRALHDVAGVRPDGYRAPLWEMNYHTPRLLAERGFSYDSSLMDSDHPYVLAADGAAGEEAATTLVEVPVSWGLDDWEQYAFLPGLTGSGLIEPGEGARDVDAGARGHAPARRRVRLVLSSVPVRAAVPRRGAGAAHRADEVTRRAVDHHRGRGGQAHGVAEAGPADLPAAGPSRGRPLDRPARLTSPRHGRRGFP